ncbi:MAG: hypothetical protein CMB36_04310 [Euryarchaeota archaeon]|nr:hypothetical protein [Euryarchaeota archaeon]|tara:strand:- start:8983 stop:11022 length:2040 start_codon:yes stop_codon:yes gene_type:complete
MAEYSDYVSPSALAEIDPEIYRRRSALSGLVALPGSGQTLSPAEFSALLGGGTTYDPTFGIYEEDPRNMSDLERVRQNMLNSGGRSVTDSEGNLYRLPQSSQTTRIGDKQYFANPDGTVTSFDVRPVNYSYKAKFKESESEPAQDPSPSSTPSQNQDTFGAYQSIFNTIYGDGGSSGAARLAQRNRAKEHANELFRQYFGRDADSEALDFYGEKIFQAVNSGSAQNYESILSELEANSAQQDTAGDASTADTSGTGDSGGSAGSSAGAGDTGNAGGTGGSGSTGGAGGGSSASSSGGDGGFSPTNYNTLLNQYYRELFNRSPSQAGLDYFNQRLNAGAYDPANLRNVLINEAGPLDSLYYQGSQSGDPVFSATQALFGRRPARGIRDDATGEFTGGYGQYMRNLESGQLTEDQLRRNLVQLAYDRGAATGQSNDYQAYLNSLGIDRANSPFAIDGGFANVPYGSDLSEYQARADAVTDNTSGGGGGTTSGGGGTSSGGSTYPSGGLYRMPGQYITGNQLFSGPYGLSNPMGFSGMGGFGKGGGFGSPYGMSQQYMPNRGLMSGYSTGFGPYGGFQPPRSGGGKGGRGGGGKGGGFGGGYNPYATGGGFSGVMAGGPSPTTTPFREQFGNPYFSGRQFGGFRDIPVGGLDNTISYAPNFGFYSGPYNDEFFRRGGVMTTI